MAFSSGRSRLALLVVDETRRWSIFLAVIALLAVCYGLVNLPVSGEPEVVRGRVVSRWIEDYAQQVQIMVRVDTGQAQLVVNVPTGMSCQPGETAELLRQKVALGWTTRLSLLGCAGPSPGQGLRSPPD